MEEEDIIDNFVVPVHVGAPTLVLIGVRMENVLPENTHMYTHRELQWDGQHEAGAQLYRLSSAI